MTRTCLNALFPQHLVTVFLCCCPFSATSLTAQDQFSQLYQSLEQQESSIRRNSGTATPTATQSSRPSALTFPSTPRQRSQLIPQEQTQKTSITECGCSQCQPGPHQQWPTNDGFSCQDCAKCQGNHCTTCRPKKYFCRLPGLNGYPYESLMLNGCRCGHKCQQRLYPKINPHWPSPFANMQSYRSPNGPRLQAPPRPAGRFRQCKALELQTERQWILGLQLRQFWKTRRKLHTPRTGEFKTIAHEGNAAKLRSNPGTKSAGTAPADAQVGFTNKSSAAIKIGKALRANGPAPIRSMVFDRWQCVEGGRPGWGSVFFGGGIKPRVTFAGPQRYFDR